MRQTVIDINSFSRVSERDGSQFRVGFRLVVNVLIELFSVSIIVLILAILLDIIVGDPSPNSPWAFYYKLHPTVWMGNFTKALERRLKNPNPRREKLNGVLLGLAVIFTFTLPVFFGLWAIFTYLGAVWTWLGIIVYAVVGIVLLKLTICIKLETDWAKAAAKAIQANDLEEARKYSHFSRRDSTNLDGPMISSAVIESMSENLIDFKLSPISFYAFLGVTGAIAFRAINTLDGMVGLQRQGTHQHRLVQRQPRQHRQLRTHSAGGPSHDSSCRNPRHGLEECMAGGKKGP